MNATLRYEIKKVEPGAEWLVHVFNEQGFTVAVVGFRTEAEAKRYLRENGFKA